MPLTATKGYDMKQRNWIHNIYTCVLETRNNYQGKKIIIQVSEPLQDLIVCQSMTEDHKELKEDSRVENGEMYLFGCQVVVTNQIPTYRIFVECRGDE
jgi:hypothetical protein